jgi:hypothetical protein
MKQKTSIFAQHTRTPIVLFILLVVFASLKTFAQKSHKPDAGLFDIGVHATPWEPIAEKDIQWKQRIWRDIDVQDIRNVNFKNNPAGFTFFSNICNGIKSGTISAYDPVDDRFTKQLTQEEFAKIINRKTINDVKKYRIKEDILKLKNNGKIITRILGIAPITMEPGASNSNEIEKPLFWIYYPDCKDLLAKTKVVNRYEDNTWYDIFEFRKFNSNIIKQGDTIYQKLNPMGGATK